MRVTSAEMQAILAEMRRVNAEPLKPRTSDSQLQPELAKEHKKWAGLLADLPIAPNPPVVPEPEPEPPYSSEKPQIYPLDQYLDDEERTRAFLSGTDMSRAAKWIHGSLPAAHHVITELAPHRNCTFETEIKPLNTWFIITVKMHMQIDTDYVDTLVKKDRVDTESDLPLAEALLCRDLFVESLGPYGIRKLNEAYRDEIISAAR